MSRMTVVESGDQLLLGGTIDESANLADLVGRARDGRLTLDLAGITFINSVGVREWCTMQKAAAAANVTIELRRVTEPIVHQLNIVAAARGVSTVTSFYAPYECDDCNRDFEVLIDVRGHRADLAQLQPPEHHCPDCGRELVFGHPAEHYFAFLGFETPHRN